jgi:hypothetical protein
MLEGMMILEILLRAPRRQQIIIIRFTVYLIKVVAQLLISSLKVIRLAYCVELLS